MQCSVPQADSMRVCDGQEVEIRLYPPASRLVDLTDDTRDLGDVQDVVDVVGVVGMIVTQVVWLM